MKQTRRLTFMTGGLLLGFLMAMTMSPSSSSVLQSAHSKGTEDPSGAQLPVAEASKLSEYVGSANGEAFVLKEKGKTVETFPIKTSLPVFKAFGLDAGSKRILYTALKNGVPSGALYVEDLRKGSLRRISPDLVLEAAWSPTNENEVAYTFSSGASFGLAIVNILSGKVKVLSPDSVLPDVVQWDNSGHGIHYFRATAEYSSTKLSPRYILTNKRASTKASAPPMSFPVLKKRTSSEKPAPLQTNLTHPADLYSFQVLSPNGQHEISGENLLGSGTLVARSQSGAAARVGHGKLMGVLNNGVVIKNFTSAGSKLEFVDWDGRTLNIATPSVVNYNLPLANSTVTQGGIGYGAPGSCNLVSHTGSPHSFAYDFQSSTIGEHVLASAAGLVVLTVSTVTCNSLDTDCSDYVPNCNQGTYLGNVVVIQHADGSYTNYAHMDKFSVEVAVGTEVCQGLHVGRQGHTGSTNGAFNGCGDHLHFQRQSSPDIFGESIAVDFSDVASNPLSCGSTLVSGSTESSYSVSPTSQSFSSSAAGGTIEVTSTGSATCGWTATSNDSFITIVSGDSGTGNGTVGYTLADNPDSSARTGTMLIAGKVVTITQYGIGYVNLPPTVNAGTDQTITLPGSANLTGTISDDGLPNPPATVTTTWSMHTGPGIVTFANANASSTIASFSDAGQYVLRLTADDAGGLTVSDEVAVTVNSAGTGGALTGSLATPASQVNLTSEGTLDWAHWGRFNASSFNHLSGVTQQISNFTRIGNKTAQRFGDNTIGYSWSNGTPSATATGTTTGIWISGLNNGFQLTVPADTTLRTLRLYVGVAAAQGKLTATLSDGSAVAYVDTDLTSSSSANGVYTLNFKAAASGQQLVLKWTTATTFISWGNITLQAATLVDASGSPLNQAPVVNAGPDQNLTLPDNTVNLMGTATDDGLPSSVLSILWSMVSGPGTVTFDNPNQAVTSATFSTAGTYILQLSADDSQLSANDQVIVTVAPANQPPTVNAGPDQTITLPASANLTGTVSDDGLPNPPAAVTTTWSMVSGPGSVTFGNANSLSTTASFSLAGQYVLRLAADDSSLSSNDDLTITVNNAGAAGTLSGSLATTASQVNLTTEGTLDWAHWGLSNAGSFNHLSSVTQQISNFTRIGNKTAQRFGDNTIGYSWSNGTPSATATGTTTGIWISGLNNGFQLTIPADTTLKTFRLYVGVAAAQGKLSATLSDGSAVAYVDTGLTSSSSANGVYTLNFQAASSGQQLVVRWTTAATFISWGNVTLQSASLQ